MNPLRSWNHIIYEGFWLSFTSFASWAFSAPSSFMSPPFSSFSTGKIDFLLSASSFSTNVGDLSNAIHKMNGTVTNVTSDIPSSKYSYGTKFLKPLMRILTEAYSKFNSDNQCYISGSFNLFGDGNLNEIEQWSSEFNESKNNPLWTIRKIDCNTSTFITVNQPVAKSQNNECCPYFFSK